MTRGTFANIRIKNKMVDKTGGYTKHFLQKRGEIFDIAQRYKNDKVPLVVLAGKEYGTGSSRDWAAKGTRLLGVRKQLLQKVSKEFIGLTLWEWEFYLFNSLTIK